MEHVGEIAFKMWKKTDLKALLSIFFFDKNNLA